MKRNPGYLLQRIFNTAYLLPYGQQIADRRRGISLDETGVYIWDLLEKERSREDLQTAYLNRFLEDPVEKETLLQDLDDFLNMLISCRIIEDDAPDRQNMGEPTAFFEIGGLILAFYGPQELFEASYLKAFRVAPHDRPDQRVSAVWGDPASSDNGVVLLRNRELIVCERETDYLLLFPTLSAIREVALSKDGSNVVFCCDPPLTDELGEQFFHALRHAFLYLAQKRGMYAIHSASICYRDRAWLFSAGAGTGKSTHVNLWKELYGTAFLNGDLSLLAMEDGRPVVHGIPWCGTSETFVRGTVPLGGIVLLKRDANDAVRELPPNQQALMVMQRFVSPLWTGTQLENSAAFAQQLSERILICRLHCTKEPSAARTMKDWIDGKL